MINDFEAPETADELEPPPAFDFLRLFEEVEWTENTNDFDELPKFDALPKATHEHQESLMSSIPTKQRCKNWKTCPNYWAKYQVALLQSFLDGETRLESDANGLVKNPYGFVKMITINKPIVPILIDTYKEVYIDYGAKEARLLLLSEFYLFHRDKPKGLSALTIARAVVTAEALFQINRFRYVTGRSSEGEWADINQAKSTRLLVLFLNSEDRERVVGDLADRYTMKQQQYNTKEANTWYRRMIICEVLVAVVKRIMQPFIHK